MDNNFEDTQDWSPKFSVNEQECINHLESLPDNEHEFESEKSIYDRKLWNHFQSCALDIAQLYKYNSSVQHNLWNSFQQASTNVACLYKECSEFQRKMFEISSQNGYNKRNKELLTWAKKKKSYIRREDLLSFLSGRSYPAPHHNSFFHHHRLAKHGRASRGSEDIQRFLNTSSPSPRGTSRLMFNDAINDSSVASPFNDSLDSQEATKLEAFREALALSGLRTPSNLLSNNNRRSPRNSNLEDLSEFISSEYQRHVEKRPSSMDVSMDSPTHSNKRAKFC